MKGNVFRGGLRAAIPRGRNVSEGLCPLSFRLHYADVLYRSQLLFSAILRESDEMDIDGDGYAMVQGWLSANECEKLAAAIGPADRAGRRGVLELPCVAELARSARLLEIVRPQLSGEPFAVRAIYFNKSAEANWFVGWHQDLTIAVQERRETPGFEAWSMKEGVPHVQPPVEVLEKMLTLRLHLDDADASNGALRVLPGTHRLGRLSVDEIERQRAQAAEVVCEARAGDVLIMRPLLLHASGRSTLERERRVLHIEYAGEALPSGLEWPR